MKGLGTNHGETIVCNGPRTRHLPEKRATYGERRPWPLGLADGLVVVLDGPLVFAQIIVSNPTGHVSITVSRV